MRRPGHHGGQQGRLHLRQLPREEGQGAPRPVPGGRAAGEAQVKDDPQNPNAWYWQAYALGRYSQGISVAKALAQGLGSKVKEALQKTIQLQPRHADAHVALGSFHAEVIDKVGSLIGSMTYGARKETGLKMFEQALTR